MTNVGTNPTVGGRARTVETHAIGQSLDLYGKRIEVAFLKRLRDEKRFETKDLLFAQIRADAAEAKKVCEERKKKCLQFGTVVLNCQRLNRKLG